MYFTCVTHEFTIPVQNLKSIVLSTEFHTSVMFKTQKSTLHFLFQYFMVQPKTNTDEAHGVDASGTPTPGVLIPKTRLEFGCHDSKWCCSASDAARVHGERIIH
jgi:hypothetical protein